MTRQPSVRHTPAVTTSAVPASAAPAPPRYRGAGLALILAAAFMVVLDSTN
jgi:hypothetical protein